MREPAPRVTGATVSGKVCAIASLIIVTVAVAAFILGTGSFLRDAAGAAGVPWSAGVVELARGLLWRVFAAAAISGAVAVAVLWWLLDDTVGQRVRRAVKEVQGFSRGESPSRMPEGRRDEIGVLVASVNRMMRQVDQWRRENRRRQRELEDSLESKSLELERVNRELARTWQDRVQREKLVSLGRMAAGVAHEIRNPLNAIGLTVAYLQEAFLPEDEAARAKFTGLMTNIQAETKRMESLVRRFLDFSRPTRLRFKYKDVISILEDVVALVQEEAQGDGVSVETEHGRPVVETMLDSERMREAFWNVIINAIQAMPGGGELKITSKVDQLGEGVELSFADTGAGVPQVDVEKVFDPYYTTKDKGVGLGLAIVRRIAEDHHGRVSIESSEDEGTTFRLWLPIRGDVTSVRG